MNLDPYQSGDFDEATACAALLLDDVLFCNSRDYLWKDKKGGHTIVLYVNCNDTFCPAADAEDVPLSELRNLYDWVKKDPRGVTKWVAARRGYKPWSRVVARMKEEGTWEEWMDKLEENNI